jgi:serine protease Do
MRMALGQILGWLSVIFFHFDFTQRPQAYAQVAPQSSHLRNLATATTVRILTPNASGSGVIVQQQGQVFTVLTNWHVLEFSDRYTILTFDGQRYMPISQPKQLGRNDLGVMQFRSSQDYQVAKIRTEPIQLGDRVFAAGFPMYRDSQGDAYRRTTSHTFDLGIRVFRLTEGVISLLPNQSLRQGYRLGYTNDIVVGMSGGPIFSAAGLLVGVNGRSKNRDPDFGVYSFEDGSQQPPILLEQIVNASWGIPITTYLQFVLRPNPVTSHLEVVPDNHKNFQRDRPTEKIERADRALSE